MKFETIGQHRIYFDEIYYLCYAGGTRGLTDKDMKEYNKTLTLPLLLRKKEQFKLGPERNPNIVPLKGINLLSFIKELKFTPFFDSFFEQSKLIQLNDVVVYESIKQRSYDIAMRG
jgi:hypothetical protein